MANQAFAEARPLFSLVSAVYNVADYLSEFIESIESQTLPPNQLQVIMVDDGSTDDSLEILQRWCDRRPNLVTVVSKPNGGQSSARNLGLEYATGHWVTFPDPDDVLVPGYFDEVATFAQKHPSTVMIATRRVLFDEGTGVQRKHPADNLFTKRDRLRNLDNDTAHFHGSAPAAFLRLDEVARIGLRFDERIRPNFEDAHFCCRYLLQVRVPLVAFLSKAVYLYRKRLDKSSTLDRSWIDPKRMLAVPEFGFLPLAQEAVAQRGCMPGWLQSMLLYELTWYFRTEERIPPTATAAHGEVGERFVGLLRSLLGYFDPDVIDSYADPRLSPTARDVLLHGLQDAKWHSPFVMVDRFDVRQELMRVRFRFTSDLPSETYYVDGAVRQPVHAKVRSIRYFGQVLLHERIVWLPSGALGVRLDDADVSPVLDEPARRNRFLEGVRIQRRLAPATTETSPREALSIADRVLIRLARTRAVQRVFGQAWVLLDRIDNANDNAEFLFRWLRRHRREKVNAWFVVCKDTVDYRRLRGAGYKRIVPYGSRRWKLLMLNAEHLVSSHADVQVVQPKEITHLAGRRTWRVSFLQHGVTKDDISQWLNAKDFDLVVTTTPAEHASLVADGSSYVYTTREVVATGMPRLDLLRRAARAVPAERRNLILLAPTWRQWLAVDIDPATGLRRVDAAAFAQSDFYQSWHGLVCSAELKDLAQRNDATITILLHPNLQRIAEHFQVPNHVTKLGYEGEDVRALFARSRVVVTDYSSISFDAAYIDRPVVYFQFDHDQVRHGGHLGRLGYFNYERDGFGPVVNSVDTALAAVGSVMEAGGVPAPEYQARIDATFVDRNGRCTLRTYRAILDSTRRVTRVSAAKSIAAQAGESLLTDQDELEPVSTLR